MFGQFVTLFVTALIAILGVFFSKSGELNKLTRVGYLFILLIFAGTIVNFSNLIDNYNKIRNQIIPSDYEKEISIKARNFELLQMIDLDQAFKYANINLSIENSVDENGDLSVPYFFGIIPNEMKSEDEISISFAIEDLVEQEYSFKKVGDKFKVNERIFGENGCEIVENECIYPENRKNGWFFESLNNKTGGGITFESERPAKYYASIFQAATQIGEIKINISDADLRTQLTDHFLRNLKFDVRMIQEKTKFKCLSKNIESEDARDVLIVPVRLFEKSECDKYYTCLEVKSERVFDLNICEPSRV